MKNRLKSESGREFLLEHYVGLKRSTHDIARELGVNANAVRRALLHHGIEPRDRSSSQRAAIASGRHPHPTRGRKRGPLERWKIADGVCLSWANDPSRPRPTPGPGGSERAKASSAGMARAKRCGSALERFLAEGLALAGHEVHRRAQAAWLPADIVLPEVAAVVQVQGPARGVVPAATPESEEADREMSSRGWTVVRVRVSGKLNRTRKLALLEDVLDAVGVETRWDPVIVEINA